MGRKKSCRPFKDFYAEWAETLRSTLLPLLRRSMEASASPSSLRGLPVSQLGGAMVASSDVLPAHVHALHGHFQAYLHALDLAARADPSQLLSPSFPSPLSLPFLFLGDLHPSLLTTLLRSFLTDSSSRHPSLPLPFSLAWRSPSRELAAKIEQIERGLRLMVPSLTKRYRDAQAGFAEAFAAEWASARCKEGGSPKGDELDGAVRARMEELTSVVLDANRLRRSVLAEIVGAVDVHQAALYLEALAQFVVGLRDPDLLREFEQCRTPLSPVSA